MRTAVKVFGAFAILGAVIACTPSFSTLTDSALSIAEAASHKWKCEACGITVETDEQGLNQYKGTCKVDRNKQHHWYRLD